eukprot:1857494-Alexandrium_andersonii.AAC.1
MAPLKYLSMSARWPAIMVRTSSMKHSGFATACMTSRTRWGDSQKPRSSSGARPPSLQTRRA